MIRKKTKKKRRGIQVYIFEKITSKEAFIEKFKVDHFSILLVNFGSVNMRINSRRLYLSANELIVIPKRSHCEILALSEDLEICQLSFSSDFAFENSVRWPRIRYLEFFMAQRSSKIMLGKKDVALVIDSFSLMNEKILSRGSHIHKEEIILHSFIILLDELSNIYHRSSWYQTAKHSRTEELVIQFFYALELNIRKEHSVKFYADTLHVTSVHLNSVVKKVIQKTTKQCIEQSVLTEAKMLLQNRKYTITDIVDELGFRCPSHFCVFFKKHCGISTSEYRVLLGLDSKRPME